MVAGQCCLATKLAFPPGKPVGDDMLQDPTSSLVGESVWQLESLLSTQQVPQYRTDDKRWRNSDRQR